MTSLVIVDDHEALREGLTVLLARRGIEVIGAAGSVATGRELVERAQPDVALVDTRPPDGTGVDLTRQLLARRPELGVILYTGDADDDLLYSGLDAGARGYALKAGSMAELVGAIEHISAGGSYVDPRLDRILLSPRATAQLPKLSPREREMMHLMAEGRTAKPIATRFNVSVGRIRRYMRNVIHRLRGGKR